MKSCTVIVNGQPFENLSEETANKFTQILKEEFGDQIVIETKVVDTIRKLNLSKDAWDYENMFRVEGVRGDVRLMKDYRTSGDGILWGLQSGVTLKASYTPREIAHKERMKIYEPINQGEVVEIEGKKYRARILGDYSDCIIFDTVQ